MRTDFSLYSGRCDVTLINPDKIRIDKKEDMALIKGFSKGEFELVESVAHGEWMIKVELNGYRQTYATVFNIDEYHLPKFDITLDTPKVVRADSGLELPILLSNLLKKIFFRNCLFQNRPAPESLCEVYSVADTRSWLR